MAASPETAANTSWAALTGSETHVLISTTGAASAQNRFMRARTEATYCLVSAYWPLRATDEAPW